MPAPEDLQTQSPGEPLATITPLASAAASTGAVDADGNPLSNEALTAAAQSQTPITAVTPALPVYTAKHNGGRRWIFLDADGARLGDYTFIGDKDGAEAEALRLSEGGDLPAPDAQSQDSGDDEIDPTTLKQAVLTPDGYLCPEPAAKE